VVESHVAGDARAGLSASVLLLLGRDVAQLPDAVEAGEDLAELGGGLRDPNEGGDEEADEEDVHDEASEGHRAGEDLPASEEHEDGGDAPEEDQRERADGGARPHLPGHALEEPLDVGAEAQRLAVLRPVRLHDADAPERLGEPAYDLGGNLRPLAEEGPGEPERADHEGGERAEEHEGHRREARVQPEQDAEGEHGGEQAAGELDEARAHQAPQPLRVVHDARDQVPAPRGVEEGDREVQDLALELLPDAGGSCAAIPRTCARTSAVDAWTSVAMTIAAARARRRPAPADHLVDEEAAEAEGRARRRGSPEQEETEGEASPLAWRSPTRRATHAERRRPTHRARAWVPNLTHLTAGVAPVVRWVVFPGGHDVPGAGRSSCSPPPSAPAVAESSARGAERCVAATLRETPPTTSSRSRRRPRRVDHRATLSLSWQRQDDAILSLGWANGSLFQRYDAYNGVRGGGPLRTARHAARRLGLARLRDGLNLRAYAAVIQLDVKTGLATAGFSYSITPGTVARASLDATGIRYRADTLLSTARLPADGQTPADVRDPLDPDPLPGVPEPPDATLDALALLSSQSLRVYR
jgi:hypothetical protein